MKKAIIPIIVVVAMAVVISLVVRNRSDKDATVSDNATNSDNVTNVEQKTESQSNADNRSISDYYGTYRVTKIIFVPSYASSFIDPEDVKKLQIELGKDGIKIMTKEETERSDLNFTVHGSFDYLEIIRNKANNYGFIPAYGFDSLFYIPDVDAKYYPEFAELLEKEFDTFSNGREQIYIQDGTVYLNLILRGVFKLEKAE